MIQIKDGLSAIANTIAALDKHFLGAFILFGALLVGGLGYWIYRQDEIHLQDKITIAELKTEQIQSYKKYNETVMIWRDSVYQLKYENLQISKKNKK